MSTNKLTLGDNMTYQVDPTIPQSIQQSAAQINAKTSNHVALINATKGGRRKRRGGDANKIVVAPLPLGASSANSQQNNVELTKMFANAVNASTYDSAVTPPPPPNPPTPFVGGKKRSRRKSGRKMSKRRGIKSRKSRKSKKSRRRN
jgi:hypothetical protein